MTTAGGDIKHGPHSIESTAPVLHASTLEGKAMTKEDSKSALKEFMLVQVEVIDRIARDCEYGSRIWRECDELLREYRLASASQPGKPVAWIASKGNETLHFSAHDGWDIQAVMTEPPPQAGQEFQMGDPNPLDMTEAERDKLFAGPAAGGSSETPLTDAFYANRFKAPDAIDFARTLERSLARKWELLKRACDNLIWCSGSSDFGPEGKAKVGYDKVCGVTIDDIYRELETKP